MAAVLEEKKDTSPRFGTQVDEQIAQTTGRIRAHDLTLGGLTLGAMTVAYATAMILFDRYLNLAEWVRQLSLFGFLLAFGAVAYWLVVRPLRKRINPLYAASRVERTIDDAKNSVTGYVEAQEKGDVHVAVKAAMSARAAKAVGEADVNRAVDHRGLIVAGGVLVLFLLVLGILFFVFRPTQFSSLVSRAFIPFTADAIAKRTQLILVKPEPAEPTITTGQTINVAVHVGGKVPAKNVPERVRVLLRHNPLDPNYEEITMEEGETTRDFQVKIPDYLVQSGFWYKVAAGDAETPEYKVTVRTLPLFTDFEAAFEYPAYMNKPADKASSASFRAYRGTKVTLVAKTNREVKEGVMKFESPELPEVKGKPAPGKPDSLEFQFTAAETTRYKLYMTTTGGEKNTDPPWFSITLDADLAPIVLVTKPADPKPDEPKITVPANGMLAVDGVAGDDFGIDKLRLRMRVDGRDLKPIPYMAGKSLRRAKDNTWPTQVEFKLSADFTKLTYADGQKFEPKLDPQKELVVEFWVEAIDNCTEAKPAEDWDKQIGNVGRSAVQRVTLTPPATDENEKQDLDQQKDGRKNEEKQHNQDQQQKFENQKRERKPGGNQPPQPPKGGENKEPKEGNPEGQPNPMNGKGGSTDNNPPKKEDGTKPKDPMQPGGGTGMGMNDPNMTTAKPPDPMGGNMDPKPDTPPKGMNTTPEMNPGGMSGAGGMTEPPMPKTPEEKKREEDAKKREEEAKRVQDELNKNKGEAGDAKQNPMANEKDRTDPAQPKPMPQDGMGGMDSQPKAEPKPNPMDPMNPMGDKNGPGESKSEGNVEKPTAPAEEKPAPKETDPKNSDPKNQKNQSGQPSETKSEPLGGTPGQDKPEPNADGKTDPKSDPKDPKSQNKDQKSGSGGKPATEKPDDNAGNPNDPNAMKDPVASAGEPKPNNDPARGSDKNPADQKAAPGAQDKPLQNENAGNAKPDKPPASAEPKPMPKSDNMGTAAKQSDMSEPKPGPDDMMNPTDPKGGNAAEAKPEGDKPMGAPPVDKGLDKPSETQKPAGGKSAPKEKGPNSGKGKLDGEKLKELEDAVKDLNDPDPKKQQSARDKLDKELGKDTREAIEKNQKEKKADFDQLQKDLKSSDKATREAAEKKVEELQRKAQQEAEKNGKGRELSKEELKDLAEKAGDLNSTDDKKREQAEKAFDDKVGKDARQQIQEEMKKRGKGPNGDMSPKEKEELKNKIEEIAKKDMDKSGKQGKELTSEEIEELTKQAQDLNSKDDKKRQEAEKALDDKIGKEAREKLQEEMKNQTPMDPKKTEDLKKKIEDMAKKAGAGKGPITKHDNTPGASTEPPKSAMEDDPRNRAKTAQLQLEEFEKHLYDKDLQEKLGWDRPKYEKFLDDQRKRAEQLQKEAQAFDEAQKNPPMAPALGAPTIKVGDGNTKVESRSNATNTAGRTSGTVAPPPGFEDVKRKFKEAADKLKPKN